MNFKEPALMRNYPNTPKRKLLEPIFGKQEAILRIVS